MFREHESRSVLRLLMILTGPLRLYKIYELRFLRINFYLDKKYELIKFWLIDC